MTDVPRYRLDDLRRFAAALGNGAGVPAPRASAFASHLTWYDESGFRGFGLETLADWLDLVAAGRVDPAAEGTVAGETLGTAVLDGRNGLPPLILARAGELAVEKSRDAGIGLVRVSGIERAGPAAAVVAAMAAGPVIGALLGPGGALALALPAEEGPAVFDSALAAGNGATGSKPAVEATEPLPTLAGPWTPWLLAMVPDGGYLVGALAVRALEPLTTVHERVGAMMKAAGEADGRLVPSAREAHRRDAREHGVGVTADTWTRLTEWAARLGVAPPSPASTTPAIAHAPGGAR